MAIEPNMLRRLRGIAAGGREECPKGCGALLHIEILHDASKRSGVERASCAKCSFAEDREPLSAATAVGILLQALDEAEPAAAVGAPAAPRGCGRPTKAD